MPWTDYLDHVINVCRHELGLVCVGGAEEKADSVDPHDAPGLGTLPHKVVWDVPRMGNDSVCIAVRENHWFRSHF